MSLPAEPPVPQLSLHDHSELYPSTAEELARLAALLQQAWPLLWREPGAAPSVLVTLGEIEVTLLDDAAIADVHADFLGDASPTDVITFHHGEILVSVETAVREAAARGEPAWRETTLYAIHGLLHLHGHTDAEPAARAHMHGVQDRLLEAVWPVRPTP